jgi:lipoprotein signal peptidase
MTIPRKARVFWPLLLIVLLADCSTKEVAESTLLHPGASRDVAGDFLRFTLVYNTGAAMGLLGSWAKEILGVVGVAATVMFFGWYRRAAADIAVHVGAVLLFVVLWREERRLRARG